MPGMAIDDTWLAELLRHRGLSDHGFADELAGTLAARDPSLDGHAVATQALLTGLEDAWERGWQPADVVHVARQEATLHAVPLVVALIAEHARRCDAGARAPDAWVDQLAELGALTPGNPAVVRAWHSAEPKPPAEAWRIVLRVAGVLLGSVRLDLLLPPPSRWGSPRPRTTGAPAAGGDRALRRIRGLLAKAESTDFPEEAEALTAKAQELMTRHAVDGALLDGGLLDDGQVPGGGPEVGTRRVHVRDPYVRAKMQLLGAVAEANDVRVVWYARLGIANLVGVRGDVAAVELLFTSLLLQAARALTAAERPMGRRAPGIRSFRRSFLLGYAHRIGERLQTARRQATSEAAAEHGVDLLPVLRTRRAAVEERASELFPRVRSSRSRASVDLGGWHAGRAAADRADVGSRRSPLT
jgi:Protein of unknown function (DUF2786)